jgi:hypothetical protein
MFNAVRALLPSLAVLVLTSFPALAATPPSPFTNLQSLADMTGFSRIGGLKGARTVKIAVLDNGFRGYQSELGRYLPAATVYHAGPVPVDAASEDAHGLYMAEIIAALLSYAPQVSYELHLYSAFGFSNLKAAVEEVSAKKFDIVLYSQVWEYGGNGDGKGFINSLVNQATKAGVVWINAAGNFADSAYRTKIARADEDWALLPGANNAVRIRCFAQQGQKCSLRAVLSWNDFKDEVSQGTDKDLDFVLFDDIFKVLRSSTLQQKTSFPEGEPGSSLYPREIIQTEVDPGTYYLRVKIRSRNFGQKDELRINISGDFVKLLDATPGETLLPPADNASVITVGASDSEKSSEDLVMKKPELLSPSMIKLSGGEQFKGSSNSAAIVAAGVALMKAARPELNREQLLTRLAGNSTSLQPVGFPGQGLPLQTLGFHATQPNCFELAMLPSMPPAVVSLLQAGALAVQSDQGIKIFTSIDPFTMIPGLFRTRMDDMLVVGRQGYQVIPRVYQTRLGQAQYEVVQTPQGQFTCGFPSRVSPGTTGSKVNFRLPDLSQF